jgi:hypothetical protein
VIRDKEIQLEDIRGFGDWLSHPTYKNRQHS